MRGDFFRSDEPPDESTRDPSGRLARALGRMEALVDWERRDRARGGMALDPEPCRALLERLGSPQASLRCVRVTGSKGKGSTAALIAAGLAQAGLRAGAYFSPHVERVNERVWIDGRFIDDETLAAALERVLAALDAAPPVSAARRASWFDVFTAASLLALAEAGLTWAVIEVGMGGRGDSTSAVRGEVGVLTNVELEHVAVLGATRAAIAREKVGILAPGASLVTAVQPGSAPWSDEAGAEIERAAARLGCALLRPAPRARTLAGCNRALAGLALDELGRRGAVAASGPRAGTPLGAWLLDSETVARAGLPARAERFGTSGGAAVVLDGAHVAASVGALLDELRADPTLSGAPVAVLGLGRDKDAGAILKTLAGGVDRVLCTSVGDGMSLPAVELAQIAGRIGLVAETATPPRMALHRALELAGSGGWVLATGSLRLAGTLRAELRSRTPR